MNTWLVTFNLLLTHINRVSYAFDTYNTKLKRMCNKYSNYHLYTSLTPYTFTYERKSYLYT